MRLCLLLFFLSLPTFLFAEGSHYVASKTKIIPSTTVAVGEKIEINFILTSSEKIILSSFALPAFDFFHILQLKAPPLKENKEGKWETILSLELLCLEIGQLEFPSLEIPYRTLSGEEFQIKTPPVKITVTTDSSPPPSAELLREIRGPFAPSSHLALLLLGLVALVGILLLFWIHRPQKGVILPLPKEPSLPPWELALRRLEEARLRFEQQNDMKLFFSELSFILRSYLAARYQMVTLEKTTAEIFSEMRRQGIERSVALEVKEILAFSDLIKFAKWQPQLKEVLEQFERVKKFILQSRPVVEVQEKEALKA